MALEVFINDKLIELKDEKTIGLTFQVGSILNPGGRLGDRSNSFSAPKTRLNNEKLEQAYNVNSATNIPYQRNSARMVQNGVDMFPDGFAIVDSSGKDYSIVIYSGNSGFFDLIKGNNVGDLDWSASDHVYDVSTIIASFTNSAEYSYPIIDWGKDVELLDDSTLQNTDALVPCAFIKDVLEKTALSVGYELVGSFLDKDQYSRLILTPNQFKYSDAIFNKNKGTAKNVSVINITNEVVGPGSGLQFKDIDLNYNNINWTQFISQVYECTDDLVGVFKLSAKGQWNRPIVTPISDPIEAILTLEIKEDGNQIFFTEIVKTGIFLVNYDMSIETPEFVTKAGSDYTAELSFTADQDAINSYTIAYSLGSSEFSFTPTKAIPYGADIVFSELFDIDQDKVFKDIMNQYSLTVQTNDITKKVSLTPLDDLLKNLGKAIDWSDKINLEKIPTIKYRIGSYAQKNFFRYSDEDGIDDDLGIGSFSIEDETLSAEADIITLNASGATNSRRVDNKHTPTIPFLSQVNGFYEKKNNRILLLDTEDTTVDFKNTLNADTGQATVDVPFCYFSKFGQGDSLNFVSLIKENYNALLGMMDQVKFVSAGFILQEIDIHNLDFSIPIFLDVHSKDVDINGFFYINKVSNFKDNSTTTVELVRL